MKLTGFRVAFWRKRLEIGEIGEPWFDRAAGCHRRDERPDESGRRRVRGGGTVRGGRMKIVAARHYHGRRASMAWARVISARSVCSASWLATRGAEKERGREHA